MMNAQTQVTGKTRKRNSGAEVNIIKRLDIVYVDLGKGFGSIQGGIRPCVVTTNDMANKFSPVVHVAPITSKMLKKKLPTHVFVQSGTGNLRENSIILLEQLMPVNKSQIKDSIGKMPSDVGVAINKSMLIQMGMAQ